MFVLNSHVLRFIFFKISKQSQTETHPYIKAVVLNKVQNSVVEFFYLSSFSSQNIQYKILKYLLKKIESYTCSQVSVWCGGRDIDVFALCIKKALC